MFDYCYKQFSEDSLTFVSALYSIGGYCSPEQNLKIFRIFSFEQLEHIGQQYPQYLKSFISNVFANFDAPLYSVIEEPPHGLAFPPPNTILSFSLSLSLCKSNQLNSDITDVWEAVQQLLEADISEETKDALKSYQVCFVT